MIIDITPEDVKRFERIMIKLAVGHARHDWDYSMPYEGSSDVKWSFLFRNESEYEDFETCPEMHILPEVGSRSLLTLTEKGQPICMWNEVQPDHYRYLIREFVTSINNFE